MNRLRTTKYYAAASAIAPAAAVLVWRSELWLLAAFVAWVAAASAVWIWCERKEQSLRMARTVSAMQTAAIRTLGHHRHDWMNDLQVLYGYIRMQKTDKTVQCVEQIRERMTTESKIAKLGVPSLVAFLQSFRTITHSLQLDIEIADEISLSELPIDGQRAAEAVADIINAYRFGVKPEAGVPARLSVAFSRDEKTLGVAFEYEGAISDEGEWKAKCRRALKGSPFKAAQPDLQPASLSLAAPIGN
ncbi:Spo0B domain-containing protein [Paenibacillus humicola]|uniref:Spo0B domain-containing protein n=1 Tax=Paenibacillus humicola TaxID=3110540 RepID=UPI00237B645C|nr:Spo0B domain-containing protein [Paenibacillus humicola]